MPGGVSDCISGEGRPLSLFFVLCQIETLFQKWSCVPTDKIIFGAVCQIPLLGNPFGEPFFFAELSWGRKAFRSPALERGSRTPSLSFVYNLVWLIDIILVGKLVLC